MAVPLCGQTAKSTYVVPDGLVRGGAFIDCFLPVPLRGPLRSDVWGADNVIPRDVDNGIEEAVYSYWGGNIVAGDDGRNHLFVCRWPEGSKKSEERQGHSLWWSSTVVHAVSDDPLGPYRVLEETRPGHNPYERQPQFQECGHSVDSAEPVADRQLAIDHAGHQRNPAADPR
jgi:hypothetical protein